MNFVKKQKIVVNFSFILTIHQIANYINMDVVMMAAAIIIDIGREIAIHKRKIYASKTKHGSTHYLITV